MHRIVIAVLLLSACAKSSERPVERLLIRSAQLVATVERVEGVERALSTSVEALGGFMTSSEQGSALTLSFRVPVTELDAALAEVASLAKRVESRQVKGDDVTEESVDLEAQLLNLEATRARLRSLLEKSATVDEALHVSKALSETQGEFERLNGRAEFLRKSVALASVTVSFIPEATTDWRPLEVARGSVHALVQFAHALGSLAIVVVVFTPVWAPIALLIRRRRRAA